MSQIPCQPKTLGGRIRNHEGLETQDCGSAGRSKASQYDYVFVLLVESQRNVQSIRQRSLPTQGEVAYTNNWCWRFPLGLLEWLRRVSESHLKSRREGEHMLAVEVVKPSKCWKRAAHRGLTCEAFHPPVCHAAAKEETPLPILND